MDTIIQILPIITILLWGYGLKKFNILTSETGSMLFKLSFFAGLPALIFTSIINSDLDNSLGLFIIFPVVQIVVLLLIMFALRKTILSSLPVKTYASLALGAIIMNTGFLIPFIEKFYGDEGLAVFAAIIMGNTIGVFTIAYAFAVNYGGGNVDRNYILGKLLISPPIWAMIVAFGLKGFDLESPEVVNETLTLLGRAVSPLTLLALGLKLEIKLDDLRIVILGPFVRFVLGIVVGLGFVYFTGIDGMEAVILLVASAAPIGFNSITFADLEKLDSKTASVQVSVGLIYGIIVTTLLLEILPSYF